MINDALQLQTIQEDWQGVRKLQSKIDVLLKASSAGGATAIARLADIPYNLPFLHACGVFNDVLLQLRDEGHFKSKQRTLGALVEESESVLEWLDFTSIEEIVSKRNEVAHDALILPRRDCGLYVDTLEFQLKAWKVIL